MSAKARLSPREKLRIFLEGLKDNVKVAEASSLDEEIWPAEYYRIKEKALSGALDALKNSGKKKDPEKNRLKKEIERLRDIVLSLGRRNRSSKKKDQLGLLGPISGYRLSAKGKEKSYLLWSRILFFQQKEPPRYWGLNLRDSIAQRKEYSLFGIDGLVD